MSFERAVSTSFIARKAHARIALLLCAVLAAGCVHRNGTSDAGADVGSSGATFVLVRHAEKRADAGNDPDLTPAGIERARVLGESLRDAPLQAAYATAYRRTQQTAAPAAALHGLQVTTYDAKEPAPALAARLIAQHRQGTVLVVGHSNTVADIAGALCSCAVAPLSDDEYDRRIRIRRDAQGRATLEEERY